MKRSILLFALLIASGVVSAQTVYAPKGQANQAEAAPDLIQLVQIHNDLLEIRQQLAAQPVAGPQDAHTYCYFGDKTYSIGSKRDDQVCVKVGSEALKPDGSLDRDKSDPLRWISAQQAARGNY